MSSQHNTTELIKVDNKIEFALVLEPEYQPRMNQSKRNKKMMVLNTAELWVWKDDLLHPRI